MLTIKASSLMPFNENALEIFIGKQKVALIGEIDISVTEKLIKKQAFGFEIYLKKFSLVLIKSKIKTSKFPHSTRDINIVIDKSVPYEEIENLFKKEKLNSLKTYSLINTFEGKDIPDDSVSMTLRLVFRVKLNLYWKMILMIPCKKYGSCKIEC